MDADGTESKSCLMMDCGIDGVDTATTHLYCGFLGYDTVHSSRWLQTFRRKQLPRSSGKLLLSGGRQQLSRNINHQILN
jgi:hypothetical protein